MDAVLDFVDQLEAYSPVSVWVLELLIVVIVLRVIFFLHTLLDLNTARERARVYLNRENELKYAITEKKDVFIPDIVPVPNFDIKTAPVNPARPFKPKFHLSMGIQKGTHNDVILIDHLYPKHTALRKQLVRDHPRVTHDVHKDAPEGILDVIAETYDMILGQILPKRWPTIFSCSVEKGFHNSISGETCPFPAPRTNGGIDALRILAENVEEDILIMTPVPGPDGDIYVLQAYAVCFPSGYFPTLKAGMTMEEIHKPVPGFKQKLQSSVDRYFRKISTGNVMRRWNWAITLDPTLFNPGGNHFYPTPEQPTPPPITKEEFDPDQANLRVEHQTLSRLPESQALIFTMRTYITPLSQIKAEGLGAALADACEGLDANGKEMAEYKRRGEWGEVVGEYLRS
ncbi:hypothetical protein BJ508DRAFT_324945 [Ascobolus immersus RN42]|uniref:HRQ family protein n=1 Tax=Ascobolus immersus RN42 TaxID=1160509 RepID=A0A3N4IFW5_ASCIM|nr:hypothetical protein BJ508DRAFT_324945 [Ascobolus immersus RN42]